MKRIDLAALLPAAVLLKLIPAVGAAPWACSLTDAVFLMLLLLAAGSPVRRPAVVFAAVAMPLLDWAIGAIQGFWVPFIAAGFLLAAFFWNNEGRKPVLRAALALFAAYGLRMLGVAFGYVLVKEMGLWLALKSVVRNGWFVFAWYAAATAAALVIRKTRRKQN